MGLSPNQSIGIIQSTNIHILIPDTRLCQLLALATSSNSKNTPDINQVWRVAGSVPLSLTSLLTAEI